MIAPRPMVSAKLSLATVIFSLLVLAAPRAQARRLSFPHLVGKTLARRTTALRLLRHLGARVRRAEGVELQRERIDEQHPALSRPDDLPRADWPNRATFTVAGRLFGKRVDVRWLTELAALKNPARKKALLNDREATLVLLVTVKNIDGVKSPLRAATVQRAMSRLGVGVAINGQLGRCDALKRWCYLQRYQIPPRRHRRGGLLILELSRPAADGASRVRAIKLIRWKK